MDTASARTPAPLSQWLEILAADPFAAEVHFSAAQFIAAHPGCGTDIAALNGRYNSEGLRRAYAAKIQALQGESRFDEALERIVVLQGLDPGNAEIPIVEGMILAGAGRSRDAVGAFIRGLDLNSRNPAYRAYFMRTLLAAGLDEYDTGVKKWLEIFLREPATVEVGSLVSLWRLMLVKNPDLPVFAQGIACADYETFKRWIESLPPAEAAQLRDDFFLRGLALFIIPDAPFEKFLTHLRRFLLELAARKEKTAPERAVDVAAALAEQCFLNEYVFFQTAEESARFAALDAALAKAKNPDPLDLAVYGCYRPLHALPGRSAKACMKLLPELARRQIEEPEIEGKLKKKIPALTKIKDDVSGMVRGQYEENPYPRWVNAHPAQLNAEPAVAGLPVYQQARQILVAGAGTGWHPIMLCLMRPEAHITGIDLSLASLAYARRKANELGVLNLSLFQADILELEARPGFSFDIVESVGVLHHMKEPEKGWRILAELVKPGGLMRIGLYSKSARRHLIECQDYVRSLGLPPTPEGIRECRRILFDLPPDHPFRGFMASSDFFAMSTVRDCLFHVQEHCFTLPRIAAALRDLGLEFLGFTQLDPLTRWRYAESFPADAAMADLDSWHEYEQKHPDTFIGMYQFWCRRK